MAKLILFILVVCFILSTRVLSHEGDDYKSQLYRDLKGPDGSNCCSVSDCKPVESAWVEDGHWKARYNDELIDIPDNKIVQGQGSPEGLQAVICLAYYNGVPWVRCFVRPGEG